MLTASAPRAAHEPDYAARRAASIASAKRYLEAAIGTRDHWSDFQTNRSGESDVWLSGYVLACVGDVLDQTIVRRVIQFLLRAQHPSGGWGYSTTTPPDTDSTLHVLLATRGHLASSEQARAITYVMRHYRQHQGLSTYDTHDDLEGYRHAPRDHDQFRGWRSVHDCVTSVGIIAARRLPEYQLGGIGQDLARALARRQRHDGSWTAYWWMGQEFVTSRVLMCCSWYERPVTDAAVKWAMASQRPDGLWYSDINPATPSALSSALMCTGLMEARRHEAAARRGLDALIALQMPSGAWSSAAALRIPPPSVVDANVFADWRTDGLGVGSISCDQRCIYTTATVLESLCRSSAL